MPENLVKGNDIDRKAVKATIENINSIPHGNHADIILKNFKYLEHKENSVIVCNPPYEIRIHRNENLYDFYKAFGDFLKQKCNGSTAFTYFGDRKYIKNLGLKSSFKIPLSDQND